MPFANVCSGTLVNLGTVCEDGWKCKNSIHGKNKLTPLSKTAVSPLHFFFIKKKGHLWRWSIFWKSLFMFRRGNRKLPWGGRTGTAFNNRRQTWRGRIRSAWRETRNYRVTRNKIKSFGKSDNGSDSPERFIAISRIFFIAFRNKINNCGKSNSGGDSPERFNLIFGIFFISFC